MKKLVKKGIETQYRANGSKTYKPFCIFEHDNKNQWRCYVRNIKKPVPNYFDQFELSTYGAEYFETIQSALSVLNYLVNKELKNIIVKTEIKEYE